MTTDSVILFYTQTSLAKGFELRHVKEFGTSATQSQQGFLRTCKTRNEALLLANRLHVRDEVHHAVAVPPLVVVPSHRAGQMMLATSYDANCLNI